MAPSEFNMFAGEEDALKFFYVFENVEMKEKSEEDKATESAAYLTGEAFQFYYETFTYDNKPTEEAKSFSTVKDRMLERFAKKKTEAEVMKEAVNLRYDGKDVKAFFNKADKLYTQAKFNDQAKFGLIREAIKADQTLLQFVLIRGAKTYDDVKKACLEYAENQKVLMPNVNEEVKGEEEKKEEKKEDTSDKIDELCKQIGDLSLLIAKQHKNPSQGGGNRPDVICHRCKKPGHYASQCQIPPRDVLVCTYCKKYGHTEKACYSKQRDEAAKARDQPQNAPTVQVLKKEEEKNPEEKALMFVGGRPC